MRVLNSSRKANGKAAEQQQRRLHRTQRYAFSRKDLLDIARYMRFRKSTLPDNEHGLKFVRALFLVDIPVPQLIELAAWTEPRISNLARETITERRKLGPKRLAERLGEIIEFTFDVLVALKRDYGIPITHVETCDVQKVEEDAFWGAERQKADRDRKRKEWRIKLAGVPKTSKRAKVVREAMNGRKWTSVPAIMVAVADKLRDQRNRRLKRHTLEVAVHRALDELLAVGLVEGKNEPAKHGGTTRFARGADMGRLHIPYTRKPLHTCEA